MAFRDSASYQGKAQNLAARSSSAVVNKRPSSGRAPAAEQIQAPFDPEFESLLVDLSSTFVNATGHELDVQIESALKRVVEFLEIDRAAFGEISADGSVVLTHIYTAPGIQALPWVAAHQQMPWWSEQMRRGRVMAFARLPDDLPLEAITEREHCLKGGVKAHLGIPIIVAGSAACTLTLASVRTYRDWPEHLIRRLRLLGEVFANAAARKRSGDALHAREGSLRRSKERLRKLTAQLLHAQEEERRRVAREMHDDWAQRLALLGLSAANVEGALGDEKAARSLLRGIQNQLHELAENVHDLSRQLHPSILDDLGLVQALCSECAHVGRREGLAINYETAGVPGALPDGAAICVYRIAQEALRNVVKHAGASKVQVSLTANEDELTLRVIDDGRGFEPNGHRGQPELGLSSMAERVRIVFGSMSIESAPGRGTTVDVRIPMRSDQ